MLYATHRLPPPWWALRYALHREAHVQKKIDAQLKEAKRRTASKDKKGALMALKRKRLCRLQSCGTGRRAHLHDCQLGLRSWWSRPLGASRSLLGCVAQSRDHALSLCYLSRPWCFFECRTALMRSVLWSRTPTAFTTDGMRIEARRIGIITVLSFLSFLYSTATQL